MRRILLIPITAACFLCGCSRMQPEQRPDEVVKVEFRLPDSYGVQSGGVTKAEDDLGPDNWHDMPDMNISLLPVGSTLWLTYARQSEDGYGKPELQGYVVGTNTGGFNTLYPCTSTLGSDGKMHINSDEIGSPLYLEAGTYKFKMISPAYPIGQDLSMQVNNGMFFYSTDGRYKETSALPIEIDLENTTGGAQYIKLNPIISQVARFDFTISKGKGVHTLEPLEAGIEISGLQDPGEDGITYNWCSEHISDTLEMRYGDKRSWANIPGEELKTESDGSITGEIGVLPTFALDYSIIILINIAVNGVPTQYMTLLNSMILLHAHTYSIKWEISVEEGVISVVTWQNQSWSTDLKPDKTTLEHEYNSLHTPSL